MLAKLRRRLNYAKGMSTLAVFLVLGGVAWAATELPENSVGTKQLKKHAVTLPKIAAGTRAALRGQRGPRGFRGPACAASNPACRGPAGAPGPAARALVKENAAPEAEPAPLHPLATVGAYAIKYRCEADPDYLPGVRVRLYANGPDGSTYGGYFDSLTGKTVTTRGVIGSGTDASIAGTASSPSGAADQMGVVRLVSGATMVTVDYTIVADGAADLCHVIASAYRAS